MRYFKYVDLESAGVLTVNEAAHVLNIGRTKVYDLVRAGEIRTLPFRRPIRIPARWLKTYIDCLGDRLSESSDHSQTEVREGERAR
jgi:excisionase family DNA binding protein